MIASYPDQALISLTLGKDMENEEEPTDRRLRAMKVTVDADGEKREVMISNGSALLTWDIEE